MTEIQIPSPQSGDVVELILDDHRLFEELLRQLRDETSDRSAVLVKLSDLLIAHAVAEEEQVYPSLVLKDAIDEEDAEHGEREHDEGNAALLELLQVEDTGSEDFSEAIEELTKSLAHHLDEEERDILNPARTDVADETRASLGKAFAAERAKQLESGCGSVENVRRIVEEAKKRAS